jgi:hypothetical protein
MTLSTLLARLETASEADQAEVLEMAFDVFFPDPFNMPDCSNDYDKNWFKLVDRFARSMVAEAYESAALLIMREVLQGWSYSIIDEHTAVMHHPVHLSMDARADGMPASLAIIAAICAAKGDGDA